MPVFDTPISTDATNLSRVLSQSLPVVLHLHNRPNTALDAAFQRVAQDNAGDILVARVNTDENPSVYADYNKPTLPALFTLDEGEIESSAENIRTADVDAHVDFLLGRGPYPMETAAETEAKAASGSAPVAVYDATFAADVLQSDIPVLVDFWAVWCGPCHAVAPVLEALAADYAGQVKIAKLNVDENPRTSGQFGIRSIPTLLMFKNGQRVGQLVGAHPRPNIEAMIQQVL